MFDEAHTRDLRELARLILHQVESLRLLQQKEDDGHLKLHEKVRRFEIRLICAALEKTHGNQAKAARYLGTGLSTLNGKIKRYGISVTAYAKVREPEKQPVTHSDRL